MYMAMDRMGFIMITTIIGTTIIIGRGGDIIDIDLGILGRITTSLIITGGRITAITTLITLITTTDTTPITILTDRVTTQIQISM